MPKTEEKSIIILISYAFPHARRFDTNKVSVMNKLFQVFRAYNGEMIEYKDKDGNDQVAVSFGSLILMRSWFERYEEFQNEIKKCEQIKDISERANTLLKAENDFNLWMDIYPEFESLPDRLAIQQSHDQIMDQMGLHPKNEN